MQRLTTAILSIVFISLVAFPTKPESSAEMDPWLKHQLQLLVEDNRTAGYEIKRLKIEDLWEVNGVYLVMATDSNGKKYRFYTDDQVLSCPTPGARTLLYGQEYDLMVKPKNEVLRKQFVSSFQMMYSDKVKDLTITYPFEEDVYLVFNLLGHWVIPLKDLDIEAEK